MIEGRATPSDGSQPGTVHSGESFPCSWGLRSHFQEVTEQLTGSDLHGCRPDHGLAWRAPSLSDAASIRQPVRKDQPAAPIPHGFIARCAPPADEARRRGQESCCAGCQPAAKDGFFPGHPVRAGNAAGAARKAGAIPRIDPGSNRSGNEADGDIDTRLAFQDQPTPFHALQDATGRIMSA